MSDPLYRKALLRLAADSHGAGRIPSPDATGEAFNPACGDKVIVDLVLAESRVSEMAHDTKACVLAQASASILGQSLKGATHADVRRLRETVAGMLDSIAPSPAPPFDSYSAFDGAVPYRNRHRCVLLPIDAVLNAFERSDARESGGVRAER